MWNSKYGIYRIDNSLDDSCVFENNWCQRIKRTTVDGNSNIFYNPNNNFNYVVRNCVVIGERIGYGNYKNIRFSATSNGLYSPWSIYNEYTSYVHSIDGWEHIKEGCYGVKGMGAVSDFKNAKVWLTPSGTTLMGTYSWDMSMYNVEANYYVQLFNTYSNPYNNTAIRVRSKKQTPSNSRTFLNSPRSLVIKQVDISKYLFGSGSLTSVANGSHFAEVRYDIENNYGAIGLLFGDRVSVDSTAFTVSSSDGYVLDGSRLYLKKNNAWITYKWPHKIKGVTSLKDFVVGGSGTANFNIEFSINNGAFQTMSSANLASSSYADMGDGFDLKIRFSKTSGSVLEYINTFYIECDVDYDTYPYSETIVDIVLRNVKDGSRYYVYNQDRSRLVATGVQSGTDNIVISNIGYYGSDETLLIRVRKSTDDPKYLPLETFSTLTSSGADIWVSQTPDTL